VTDPLYPVPLNDEATKFIFARARPARDEHGTMLLAAPLTAPEREIIRKRMHEIAPALASAKPAELRKALLEIFPDVERDVAKKRAKALAEGMEGLPLFAVRRAALKLSQAGISSPERVRLRTEAEAIARPHWNEASVASLLLRAKKNPDAPPNEAERERVVAGFAALQAKLAEAGKVDDEAKRAALTERMNERDREWQIGCYREEGLAPVFADAEERYVVSIPLLLSLGWRIEEVGGRNVLVRPDGRRRKQGKDQTDA